MKVIAVSQRVDKYPERDERRDALDERLIRFLLVAGYVPVPVPNGLHKEIPGGRRSHEVLDTWVANVAPAAIVLSGGNDIGQNAARDMTEGWLLDYASDYQLPLLGICRGMQMMAHRAGASLQPVKGHVRTRHKISGQIEGEVNSYHGFSLANCPDDFKVLAESENGEIEAIRHLRLPWEGWMWHPEREEVFSARDIKRLKQIVGF